MIFLNTVILSLDRYPMPNAEYVALELINLILTYLFIAEMVIKLIGLGVKDYARDKFNIFDAIIVILSIVEMLIDAVSGSSATGGAISAFRGVRLLRVFKLARSWKSF